MTDARRGRRFDLDWIRTLATLAVLLFHCARFFDDGGWHVGVALKYPLLVLFSFAVIMLLYEGLIRRWNPLRFLFGMKRRRE